MTAEGRAAGRGSDPLRRLRRSVRGALLRLLARGAGDGSAPPPDLRSVRRLLLVHVSPRLGNTVLASAGVAALAEALPETELVFVGGPAAPPLLRGLRVARVHVVARGDAWRPWRLLGVVRALRRERCDAALHLSTATGSLGAFLVGVSGAPHRLGVRREGGNVFFTSAVPMPEATHKVDQVLELLERFGVAGRAECWLALAPDERAAAARSLEASFGARGAPVAIFAGGRARKGKAWPLAGYARVAEGLRAQGIPLLVLLGPEELGREAEIRAAIGEAEYRAEPDLRRVAALLGACRAVLTPDAGPMHLAVAVGAPTVAVFVRANYERWGPRPPQGAVVHDPDASRAGEVLDAVLKLCAGAQR